MKWINHQIVTGFIVSTATDDAIFTASAIVGAVLPDRVEGSPPKENKAYWKWRNNHRTWSHYPPIYFALIAAAQIAKTLVPSPYSLIPTLITYALIPRKKYGIKLFKVGSRSEYFFAALIIFICLFARFGDINSLPNLLNF